MTKSVDWTVRSNKTLNSNENSYLANIIIVYQRIRFCAVADCCRNTGCADNLAAQSGLRSP
jgi:hypothetical protein